MLTTFQLSGTGANSLLNPEESSDQLQSSLTHGLSSIKAGARLPQTDQIKTPELCFRLLKQFKETLILLLLASAAI